MIDLINSLFQAGAIFFLCLNIRQIVIHSELKGVSIFMIVYFTVWGYWGIFMFYTLHQFWSMVTNIGIATAYTIWLTLALRLKLKGYYLCTLRKSQ